MLPSASIDGRSGNKLLIPVTQALVGVVHIDDEASDMRKHPSRNGVDNELEGKFLSQEAAICPIPTPRPPKTS